MAEVSTKDAGHDGPAEAVRRGDRSVLGQEDRRRLSATVGGAGAQVRDLASPVI